MTRGTIVSIHIADRDQAPMRSVAEITAISGRGLEGDRYASAEEAPKPKRQVTLIEAEAIEALERDYQIALLPGESRRNITTRGVALNHLVGRTFQAGEALLRGIILCEPCGYLEKLTGKPVIKGLTHRGGLRAEVIRGGRIRVGNVVAETQDGTS